MTDEERDTARKGEISHRSSLADALERVLDKGIVIDARLRVSVASIHLVDVEACVVVASVETYLDHERMMRGGEATVRPASRRFLFSNELFLPEPLRERDDVDLDEPDRPGP